jgi:hypothetical protein
LIQIRRGNRGEAAQERNEPDPEQDVSSNFQVITHIVNATAVYDLYGEKASRHAGARRTP